MIMSKQENFQMENSYILRLSFSQMREIIKSEAKMDKFLAKQAQKWEVENLV